AMTSNSRTRTTLFVALPLAALLALILFGYQREANRREQYFTRRNLRVLSVLAQQTEAAVAALQRALGAAVRAAEDRQKVFLDLQASGAIPVERGGDAAYRCKFERTLKDKLDLVPGMQLLADGPTCDGEACQTVLPRLANAPQTSLALRHRALHHEVEDSEPKDSALVLCQRKPEAQLKRAIESGSCLDSLKRASVCVAVELSFLLESRIADGPLDGLNVFLADQTGRVLYQRGSAALNILSLANGGKDAKPANDGAASDATRRGLPAIADLQTMTGVETVSVDGFTVSLMSQPLRIAASSGGDTVWVLGVLAPQGGVNAQASVSFAAVAAIPLVILLGLMVTPLLKWASLGPREGLSRWTIVGMAGGLVGGAALATVLGLGWYAYAGLTARADAELRRLSTTLHRHVGEELRAIDATLTSFIDERQSAAGSGGPASDGYAICTGVLSSTGRCSADGAETQQHVDRLRPALLRYPHFEMLTMTRPDGWQYEKWAARGTTTPMISMAEMSTFRDARDGRGIELPGDGETPASRLALNVTISPNTGETLVVASRAMPDGDGRGGHRGVALLVSHMVSLVGPVVPPDTGFAVIENHGRVLFHSTAGRRLYENFYAEAQGDDALRAAVHARHAATIDLTYHGRAVRAAVAPLAGTPWSLIVYRDKEILRTLSLEAAATAGMGFVTLFLLVAFCIGLLAVLLAPAVAEIPWPDPRRAPRYAATVAVLAVLAVWLGWALHAFAPADRLLAALLTPPLALMLAALNLGRLESLSRWRRWTLVGGALLLAGAVASISWFNAPVAMLLVVLGATVQGAASRLPADDHAGPRRWWYLSAYVALSALLLLTLAVLPAVVLIGDAVDLSAETHNRRRQLALADALGVHAAELRERYGSIDGSDALFESLVARGWDVPALPAFSPPRRGAAAPAAEGLVHRIAHRLMPACTNAPCAAGRYHPQADADANADLCALSLRHFSAPLQRMLPIYSQEALEVRYGAFESASDCGWTIPAGPYDVPDPRWQARPSMAGSAATVTLAPPLYVLALPTDRTRLVAVLCIAAIVAGVVLWLLFLLVSRLFGLPEPEPTALSEDIEAGRGLILVRSSLGDPAGPGFQIVDLSELDNPAALPATTCDFGEHLIVRHLERCLEPAWSEAGLTWLEDLARRRAPALTLETKRDVTDYLEEPASPDPAPPSAPAGRLSERWAHLLARFALQPAAKPTAPAPVEAADWEGELDHECRWTPRLRGIAAELRAAAGQGPAGGHEGVVGAVAERAEAHYRSIWCGLSDEERLVLNHLARHGFVSPRSWRIVRRLGERGLVRRDPALRLMNESFARFVARAEDRATLKGWQHAAGTTAWEWVRNGFAAVVVVAAVVMYLTRPDSLSTWVTFVTAIATLGAKATDVLGFFQVSRKDAKA
ncbi:MAG: cache domain-containing protein, partial [Candidatus Binatia bacterium]